MKNYDVNICWGIARIRVYLQMENYKGFYDINSRGYLKGADLLETAIETDLLEQDDIKNSNCEMKIFENKEEDYCFSCVLKDKQGNTLEIDEEIEELPKFIVGCHIIEYKESE